MSSKALLITGATGKQGSALINALLKANYDFTIIALTRNAQSPSAQKLLQKSPKVKVITGNLDDISSVFTKAQEAAGGPIWGVFSVQVAIGDGQSVITEERQGKAMVDTALANKVSHFVYTSVDRGGDAKSAAAATYVPHFASKHAVEQHLFAKAKGSDMSYTVLRPAAFMDNLDKSFFGKHFATSWAGLPKTKKLQIVATSDIGFFAAEAFAHAQENRWRNVAVGVVGDELSFDEFKKVFEWTTGQTLPMTFRFVAVFVNWMVKELGTMYRWFAEEGFEVDIAQVQRVNPEMKDFRAWLKTESAWTGH